MGELPLWLGRIDPRHITPDALVAVSVMGLFGVVFWKDANPWPAVAVACVVYPCYTALQFLRLLFAERMDRLSIEKMKEQRMSSLPRRARTGSGKSDSPQPENMP